MISDSGLLFWGPTCICPKIHVHHTQCRPISLVAFRVSRPMSSMFIMHNTRSDHNVRHDSLIDATGVPTQREIRGFNAPPLNLGIFFKLCVRTKLLSIFCSYTH